MTDIDISTFTEKQKEEWTYYGIVPGPIHNNFDVCDKSCYVATFDYVYPKDRKVFERGKERITSYVDIYLVPNKFAFQSVLYRQDSEWEGSYGSSPLNCFIDSAKVSDLHQKIINILQFKGRLEWKSNKNTKYVFEYNWCEGEGGACGTTTIPFECENFDDFILSLAEILKNQGYLVIHGCTIRKEEELLSAFMTLEKWCDSSKRNFNLKNHHWGEIEVLQT